MLLSRVKLNYKFHQRNWNFVHCICSYIFPKSVWSFIEIIVICIRDTYYIWYLLHSRHYYCSTNEWMNESINQWSVKCKYFNWASDKILTKTKILEFFYFMRKKITFYMCNNFNSFQIICSLFPPTQTYAQLPCKAGLSQNFHIRKCWIFAHFYIWISKNVPFPVCFKQMCRHNEQWRQLPVTEPKILPRNLNTSYLQWPIC